MGSGSCDRLHRWFRSRLKRILAGPSGVAGQWPEADGPLRRELVEKADVVQPMTGSRSVYLMPTPMLLRDASPITLAGRSLDWRRLASWRACRRCPDRYGRRKVLLQGFFQTTFCRNSDGHCAFDGRTIAAYIRVQCRCEALFGNRRLHGLDSFHQTRIIEPSSDFRGRQCLAVIMQWVD